jgi:hypothetical protein
MRERELESFLYEKSAARQAVLDYVRGLSDTIDPNLILEFIKGAPRVLVEELNTLELADPNLIDRRERIIKYVELFEPKLSQVEVSGRNEVQFNPNSGPLYQAAAEGKEVEEGNQT